MINFKKIWISCNQVLIVVCLLVTLLSTSVITFVQPVNAMPIAAISASSSENLKVLGDRFDRLEKYVYSEKWNDVITYIHGPFGEIRRELRMVAAQLDKTKKEKANTLANDLFKNFVKLDNAANSKDAIAAESAFKSSLQNFEDIVELTQ
ncbi:MAG: hypothetical protein DCE90_04150 [Pseudanabaena sp.]|nr:MAG: hypothetical protein DCE90_04150 [Pseudanabaena sp.]